MKHLDKTEIVHWCWRCQKNTRMVKTSKLVTVSCNCCRHKHSEYKSVFECTNKCGTYIAEDQFK